jgi:hypothetical protein
MHVLHLESVAMMHVLHLQVLLSHPYAMPHAGGVGCMICVARGERFQSEEIRS